MIQAYKTDRKKRINQREKAIISADLRWKFLRDMKAARIQPQTILPSINEITSKYRVSLAVARDLYHQLKEQKIVEPVKGKGVFLRKDLSSLKDNTEDRTKGIKLGVVAYIQYEKPEHLYTRDNIITQVIERKSAHQHGSVVLYNIAPKRTIELDILEKIKSAGHDAIILLNPSFKSKSDNLRSLLMLDVPVISVGIQTRLTHSVLFEHYESIQKLVTYFVDKGLTKQAFIQADCDNYWAKERLQAFHDTLNDDDLIFKIKQGNDPNNHLEYFAKNKAKIVEKIIESECQGIICSGDAYAVEIIKELETRGINVPADISVAGIGDDLNYRNYNLTTVQQSHIEAAKIAYELAAEVVTCESDDVIERRVECPLLVRNTTL